MKTKLTDCITVCLAISFFFRFRPTNFLVLTSAVISAVLCFPPAATAVPVQRNQALITASEHGNSAKGKLLVGRGTCIIVTRRNERGTNLTALIEACLLEDLETVNLLLERGVNVNGNGSGQYRHLSPLYAAAATGNTRLGKLLLDRGADVNLVVGGYRETALIEAAKRGNLELVKLILDKGADVNHEGGPYERSALMFAVSRGDGELVKLLLDRGADVKVEGGDEYTTCNALTLAAINGHLEILKMLLHIGRNVNYADSQGGTILMAACEGGDYDTVQFLLDNGANVKARNRYGTTALMWAARYGRKEIVKLLLEKGADVNAEAEVEDQPLAPPDRSGTALMFATGEGHIEIVRLLLDMGADVHARTREGVSALAIATRKGYGALKELLREHGAKE